uniref:Pre-mRNA-splicing factor Syf1-like N-terminal HAT-repeats domain-containing protein n=1 Tax=Lactuca sativa TaxID=4236 RepID=A0A9R1V341_LACSA|nr:hypothetical protein LSAT_V11C700352160 [Lactuca sativa]
MISPHVSGNIFAHFSSNDLRGWFHWSLCQRELKEREIRATEERLLQKDVPRTADDYEKLIRTSPNSSFIWIKYMTFFLSLNEVEKARSMAERALKTINIREESEKQNVWVAYFNLENEYGSPPEDTVFLFKKYLEFEKN